LAAEEAPSQGDLRVVSFVLGPALTNAYLVGSTELDSGGLPDAPATEANARVGQLSPP
jgi:hypothetical protein